MTTVANLANQFGMQPHELYAYSDDLLDGLGNNDEIPSEAEAFITESIRREPIDDDLAGNAERENRYMDRVADVLTEIEQASGWADSQDMRAPGLG